MTCVARRSLGSVHRGVLLSGGDNVSLVRLSRRLREERGMQQNIICGILRTVRGLGLSARVLVGVALAGALVVACDVHGVTAPGTLVSMTVLPNATLVAGSTQQMTAVGYDADGRVVTVSPTWTAGTGGTINSSGMFSAGTVPGLFANTVTASVGSISAHATITVIPGALATIAVTPTPVTLAVGSTQQFIAVGKDAAGNIVAWPSLAWTAALDQRLVQLGFKFSF